jgi:hypothetical protein
LSLRRRDCLPRFSPPYLKDAKNESHGDAQHFSEHPIYLRELADRPAISESCQDLRFPNFRNCKATATANQQRKLVRTPGFKS